ncbi:MAG: acetyl/propionyl/methylcrotonyl-CoA carboxylase subunit alpha [Alphaproteobacteria bacterium]|nr:acetyl/propionyl/methylcrotonyl-CoA carboxylase subunit alpha [Alphaproteobacteria bacterium]
MPARKTEKTVNKPAKKPAAKAPAKAKRAKPFKKILIANRGEIACRVIRTAKKMGIQTVAVHSEADRDALHVLPADEAHCIGPAASSQSYLRADKILEVVKATGADAVHPGYGFLSENAAFCRMLKRAGVAFIGPNELAIKAMGDKIESKKLAEKAGVNVVPGHTEALKDYGQAKTVAAQIGYPVMLKASAGGGGKGMRVCFNDGELKEAFVSTVREAKSSFGDDRVFIEKFIVNPRHIEIQVMADSFGNTVYLGERECSIQRRHQKVVEEAPSPFLDPETRAAMGEQAVQLAKAVKYVSAGTVEFIVDQDKNFYFLEMNTRLQVEHPVTELVTGLDLVELMIRVAAGEKLPITQADVKLDGWAIETRVYAEDPFRNFLPSIGRLKRYRAPEGEGVRVDTGVYEGGEISMHYDPMIAKLITYGADRDLAIGAMRHALDGYYIRGVEHNIAFLSALMNHPRFVEGRLSTGFIAEEYPDGFHASDVLHDDPSVLISVAASMHRAYQDRAARISGQQNGHERRVADDWTVIIGDKHVPVTVGTVDGGYEVDIHAKGYATGPLSVRTDWKLGETVFEGTVGGRPVIIQADRLPVGYRLLHAGAQADIRVMSARAAAMFTLMPEKLPPDTSKLLLSPMPGLLLSVSVVPGQDVKAGEELAVIEAMKMENVLRAAKDGTIEAVSAKPGDSLAVDQVILTFA